MKPGFKNRPLFWPEKILKIQKYLINNSRVVGIIIGNPHGYTLIEDLTWTNSIKSETLQNYLYIARYKSG